MRPSGTVAYDGVGPHIAHPLLAYSEMATSLDPRMREAADEIRERFLNGLPGRTRTRATIL